jgi:hypothetical protein
MKVRVEATSQVDLHQDPGHSGISPHPHRFLDGGAIVFLATVVSSLICIAFLALNIFAAAHHLETAKRNAETVARVLADVGAKRKAGQPEVAECHLRPEDAGKLTWGPCWEAITKLPDIAKLTNPLQTENAVFGPPCDGTDESIGRITLEKGTPWFSAGNTGVTYAASDSEDSIATETPLRVQVCNRWGEAVKVQEIKF